MSVDSVSRAPACALPGGLDRRGDRRSATPGREPAGREDHAAVGLAGRVLDAHDARAAARTTSARPRRGPRSAPASARRGCARCRRPARGSGRSRTATPRSGSASRPPPASSLLRRCCCCCCCCCGLRPAAPVRLGDVLADRRHVDLRAPAGPGLARRVSGRFAGGPASTQVSLDPPPRLELTISSPSGQGHPGQAAGQHPDVVAVVDRERPQVDVPRARCRRSISVGTVDSETTGCAIQPRGSARILRAQLVELRPSTPPGR